MSGFAPSKKITGIYLYLTYCDLPLKIIINFYHIKDNRDEFYDRTCVKNSWCGVEMENKDKEKAF